MEDQPAQPDTLPDGPPELLSNPLRLELNGDTDLKELARTLRENEAVTNVDVCVHESFLERSTRESIIGFFDDLGTTLKRLRKFEFYPGTGNYNNFPVAALGAAIQHCQQLEVIYLYHLELVGDAEQFKEFSFHVQRCTSLKEFCFIDCQMDADSDRGTEADYSFDFVIKSLGDMPSLNVVAIWANDLGLVTTGSLVKICQSPSIERLMILGFNLSDADASVMFQSLCDNGTLKRLNISCTLGNQASSVLSQMLQRNTVLEKLKIELDEPLEDDKNLVPIAEGLTRNKKLDYLKVSGHSDNSCESQNSSGEVEQAFVSMLKENVTLETLSLLDGSVHTPAMDLYLKLNMKGRRNLFQNESIDTSEPWIEALLTSDGDIDSLFYYLLLNPSICIL